jgi:hypothetical protein
MPITGWDATWRAEGSARKTTPDGITFHCETFGAETDPAQLLDHQIALGGADSGALNLPAR